MAEKSHTKTWQRVVIGFIAVLFIVTSGALTIAVLVQSATSNSDDQNDQPTAQQCTFGTVSGETVSKPAIYKTASDVKKLQVKDLVVGSGKAAAPDDCLVVKYYGTLAKSGKLFDETFTKPIDLKFALGQSQVIPGWDEGLIGMKVGGTRRLVIPSELGYGEAGSPPTIPANADLVFIVKLIKIQ